MWSGVVWGWEADGEPVRAGHALPARRQAIISHRVQLINARNKNRVDSLNQWYLDSQLLHVM